MALTKFNYNSFDVTPVASKALAFNSDADGFTTGTSSSMVLIKTLTASSSATLSFVDGASDVVLDNTYPIYMFKFYDIHPSTASQLLFNMSIDSGSNYNVSKTAISYVASHSEADATAFTYQTARDLQQSTAFMWLSSTILADNDGCASGTLTLFSPSDTTFVKHFISRGLAMNTDPGPVDDFFSGFGDTTSAVDAIQFKMSSGNIDAGTIKMYGLKDS